MFRKNEAHEQERLFSPLKELESGPKSKLETHWSSHFYEHVFTQIDEERFEGLYHDGYSRPNKPVNELVSLEIIKHLLGLSDEELEYAYLFDFRVRNALGKETLGGNICPKTFTNFRRRLVEYEEETGRNLLKEVFENHRDYLQDEFEIDASTQRMDSTFLEANIKQLSRIDLIATVLHNFLEELSEELLQTLPEDIQRFADTENLDLSYRLDPGAVESTMETLVEHAGQVVDRFESNQQYAQLESFAHLQRVLDEQCYRIGELEHDHPHRDDDNDDRDNSGDQESPEWEPIRSGTSTQADPAHDQASGDSTESGKSEQSQDGLELKPAEDIDSGSLQNPHDEEATYRCKNGEDYHGYKANVAETCDGDNPFRLITAIGVDTNNTDDSELLKEDAAALAANTGLSDLLSDGGYTQQAVEQYCREHGITQHFSGIKGRRPDPETVSPADAQWDGHNMVACPAGHEPFEQQYSSESGRYSGRMDKQLCAGCPHRDNCFVNKRQDFYSYGFYERKLTVARRRQRLDDPAEADFLNLRAGAESLINEVYHQDRVQALFTGKTKVKNASIAKAIGTNLKRASRFLESEANGEQSAG